MPFAGSLRRSFLLATLVSVGLGLLPRALFADDDSVPVTRFDLAAAYLRLERAYFANLPEDDSRVAAINEAFDTATLAFFGGQFGRTIQGINELTANRISDDPSTALQLALSLKATTNTPILQLPVTALPIRLTSIYPVDAAKGQAIDLPLRLTDQDSQTIAAASVSIEVNDQGTVDTTATVELTDAALGPGMYSVELVPDSEPAIAIGRVVTVAESLDAIRKSNQSRLDSISPSTPEIEAALAACRDRNNLLQDEPSSEQSSQFLTDPNQLIEQLASEIDTLSAGRDPYHRRPGDYWRTVASDRPENRIPLRVFAPPATVGDQPVPLLVVLHGAGGDENMFFEGYGAGRIKELARQHGFLVASPLTYAMRSKGENLDRLVEELSYDYEIDPAAIYVLGHSMGAGATMRLAGDRSEKIRAACCLAGGGRTRAESLAPTLMIAAELDKIVSASRVRSGAQRAIDTGLPVEYRELPNYGHTLMVGAVLDDAVDWLLSSRD